MIKKLFFAALLLCAFVANAQTGTATVSWVVATTYTDNNPIPAGDLTGTLVLYGPCAGTAPNYTLPFVKGSVLVPMPALSYTFSNLPTNWSVPTCFVSQSVSKTHGKSDSSNVVAKALSTGGTTTTPAAPDKPTEAVK